MKTLSLLALLLLFSIGAKAQIAIENLIGYTECQAFACISQVGLKGYEFADSSYDAEFKIHRYHFVSKGTATQPQNMLTLEYDAMSNTTLIHFETLTEDYYRKLENDVETQGFSLYQTLSGGGKIYRMPNSNLRLFIETDTYDDGLHYGFTVNRRYEGAAKVETTNEQ